jgi:hypothetical protein
MGKDNVQQPSLRCPVCGGQFAHIGDGFPQSITYTPWDAEPHQVLGCTVRKSVVLSFGAVHVCLGCGFVGHFAHADDLQRLRERAAKSV